MAESSNQRSSQGLPSDPRPDPAGSGKAQRKTPPSVIGVLGGIASGKSQVARALAGSQGICIDADKLAREALESAPVVELLRTHFGAEVLDRDGHPDRAALARRVFSDPHARRQLESWTHPLVRDRILAAMEDARRAGRLPIVLDVPLLLENDDKHGLARKCDALIYVDVDRAERERRARTIRNWEPGELAQREAAQWSQQEKRRWATHVIPNSGDLLELTAAVEALRGELKLN